MNFTVTRMVSSAAALIVPASGSTPSLTVTASETASSVWSRAALTLAAPV